MQIERRYLIQHVQDLLADFCGLPLAVLPGDVLDCVNSECGDEGDAVFRIADCIGRWSRSQSFFRVLGSHTELTSEAQKLLKEVLAGIGAQTQAGDVTLSSEGVSRWRYAGAPITSLSVESGNGRRKLEYSLCVGPVYIRGDFLEWDDVRELIRSSYPNMSRSLQTQLACELLEIPTRPSESGFRQELNTLRMTWNGVIRDLLPLAESGQLPCYSLPELEMAVFELYSHIRTRSIYFGVLAELASTLKEDVDVAFVILRNPTSGTGFMALHYPAASEEYDRNQLVFIPTPGRLQKCLDATSWLDMPEEDVRHLTVPRGDPNLLFLPLRDLPVGAPDAISARFGVWGTRRSSGTRIRKQCEELVSLLVRGLSASWELSTESAKARLFKSHEDAYLHKRNELFDAISLVPLSHLEDRHASKSANIRRILVAAQEVLGFAAAAYYRPVLFQHDPIAVPLAAVGKGGEEQTKHTMNIDSHMFEALFNNLERYEEEGLRSAIFPVLAGNRCIALLRVEFPSSMHLRQSIPLLAGLSNRLGARVITRRLLALLESTSDVLQDEYNAGTMGLARSYASLLSEAACSIWEYSSSTNLFRLLDRDGVELELSGVVHSSRIQDSLLHRCVEEGQALRINLETAWIESRDELLKSGIRHGVAIPASIGGHSMVIVLWSRSEPSEGYFSDDELKIVQFVSLVLLHYRRLKKLMEEREELLDTVLAGLGHDVTVALSFLRGNLEGLDIVSRQRHLLADMTRVTEYVQALMSSFSLYAELDSPERLSSPRRARPLFEGIVYRVMNVLRWSAAKEGIDIRTDFEPRYFPSGLSLNDEEEKYLFTILFNLASNAVKYSHGATGSEIVIEGDRYEDWITISVHDGGIGIAPGEEESVFERRTRGSNAWRASPSGSGLGLYTSRNLAERLGGKLELVHRKDPTVFRLSVPSSLAVWGREEIENRVADSSS